MTLGLSGRVEGGSGAPTLGISPLLPLTTSSPIPDTPHVVCPWHHMVFTPKGPTAPIAPWECLCTWACAGHGPRGPELTKPPKQRMANGDASTDLRPDGYLPSGKTTLSPLPLVLRNSCASLNPPPWPLVFNVAVPGRTSPHTISLGSVSHSGSLGIVHTSNEGADTSSDPPLCCLRPMVVVADGCHILKCDVALGQSQHKSPFNFFGYAIVKKIHGCRSLSGFASCWHDFSFVRVRSRNFWATLYGPICRPYFSFNQCPAILKSHIQVLCLSFVASLAQVCRCCNHPSLQTTHKLLNLFTCELIRSSAQWRCWVGSFDGPGNWHQPGRL
mmetsp:Transcript_32621/g.58496  ORF Transcript_32621/g.58496 Transcript_32621/m.58496 type:complete len:330 (+) Transcript_32621:2273-3262(+)